MTVVLGGDLAGGEGAGPEGERGVGGVEGGGDGQEVEGGAGVRTPAVTCPGLLGLLRSLLSLTQLLQGQESHGVQGGPV
jgi:hypothetical protein